MPNPRDMHIGARIAEQRKLAHLTQRGLAQKAHVSLSLLTKVETGNRPASPALVAACARALGLDVSLLSGQPYVREQREDRFDAPIAAVRASLENWDVPINLVSPRPLAEIAKDVRVLGEQRRKANFLGTAVGAPPLIDELVEASHLYERQDLEKAHRLLAYTYRCVHDVAYKLGLLDLGNMILCRMSYSAERSGDPYMVILHAYLRAQSCFNTGRHEVGLRLMERSLTDVEDQARRAEQAALCVQGNLRLRATMLAARTGPSGKSQADNARAQWQEAWEAANRLGGDTQNYVLSFGPSNTAIHGVAMEVELGNYGAAVSKAEEIRLPASFAATYPDRVSHHFIDLSRAQLCTGDREGALESIQRARTAAPQQTRFHPQARETVSALLRADRTGNETLARCARWMGV